MELLLLLIVAGIIGFLFGRSREPNQPASQQVVDAEAKDSQEKQKTDA
ncbi:MAG: hypothetical protein ACWGO1_02730 [Anaerolineales bacterium]